MFLSRYWVFCSRQKLYFCNTKSFSISVGWQQNHYEILEIRKDASLEQVKNAFIKKSKLFHPDRHHGDQVMNDKFVTINEAYRVLSDPEQRALYNFELSEGAGGKTIHAVHRSRDYRSPYEKVKGFTTDWSDYYSTYGGGKAERDMRRDADSRFWKDYMDFTKKYGGGEMHEGMSPYPKSTIGLEMVAISIVLITIYILGFLHSSTGDKSMDHDRFDSEHRSWLMAQKNKKD